MVVNMDGFEKIAESLYTDIWVEKARKCSYLVTDKKGNLLETIHFQENRLRPGIYNRDLAAILLYRYKSEGNEEHANRMRRILGEAIPRKRGSIKAKP